MERINYNQYGYTRIFLFIIIFIFKKLFELLLSLSLWHIVLCVKQESKRRKLFVYLPSLSDDEGTQSQRGRGCVPSLNYITWNLCLFSKSCKHANQTGSRHNDGYAHVN